MEVKVSRETDSTFNDFREGTAVADALKPRRHGRVAKMLGKGSYVVRWLDGEMTTSHRDALLSRYSTQSAGYKN